MIKQKDTKLNKKNAAIGSVIAILVIIAAVLFMIFQINEEKEIIKDTNNQYIKIGDYKDIIYLDGYGPYIEDKEFLEECARTQAVAAGYRNIDKYAKEKLNLNSKDEFIDLIADINTENAEMFNAWLKVPVKINEYPPKMLKKQKENVVNDMEKEAKFMSNVLAEDITVERLCKFRGTTIQKEAKQECRDIMTAKYIADKENIKVSAKDKKEYEFFYYIAYDTTAREYKRETGIALTDRDSFEDDVLIWKVKKFIRDKGTKGCTATPEIKSAKSGKIELAIQNNANILNTVETMANSFAGDYKLDIYAGQDKEKKAYFMLSVDDKYPVSTIEKYRVKILKDENLESDTEGVIANAGLVVNTSKIQGYIKKLNEAITSASGIDTDVQIILVDGDYWRILTITENSVK